MKSSTGDQDSDGLGEFGRAFDAHANVVYRYAVRLTGDWSTAEEIVSLTFLEAWWLRDRLRPGSELRPWLLGIATNVVRNLRRAARRHRAALQRLPPPASTPDIAEDVVGRMHDADQLAAAVAALQKLRGTEREVFALCVWSGLAYAAAADALGIPVGTVRSRLSRARTGRGHPGLGGYLAAVDRTGRALSRRLRHRVPRATRRCAARGARARGGPRTSRTAVADLGRADRPGRLLRLRTSSKRQGRVT